MSNRIFLYVFTKLVGWGNSWVFHESNCAWSQGNFNLNEKKWGIKYVCSVQYRTEGILGGHEGFVIYTDHCALILSTVCLFFSFISLWYAMSLVSITPLDATSTDQPNYSFLGLTLLDLLAYHWTVHHPSFLKCLAFQALDSFHAPPAPFPLLAPPLSPSFLM
jgi:hypothetical protein